MTVNGEKVAIVPGSVKFNCNEETQREPQMRTESNQYFKNVKINVGDCKPSIKSKIIETLIENGFEYNYTMGLSDCAVIVTTHREIVIYTQMKMLSVPSFSFWQEREISSMEAINYGMETPTEGKGCPGVVPDSVRRISYSSEVNFGKEKTTHENEIIAGLQHENQELKNKIALLESEIDSFQNKTITNAISPMDMAIFRM